jgi:hypothetical protein
MLGRDEMKEIIGGSGGSGDGWINGGAATILPDITIYSGGGSSSDYSNYYYSGYSANSVDSYLAGLANSGGNSNNSGAGGGFYVYQEPAGHNLPRARLPVGDGTTKQVKNLCVFRNMEVVQGYFGKSISEGTLIMSYAQQFNKSPLDPIYNGFDGTIADLTSFVNKSFTTIACTDSISMINAINNNQPILAFLTNSVSSDGSIDGHEVTITGYNPDTGLFRYYDSVTDTYKQASGLSFSNALAVTGSKG